MSRSALDEVLTQLMDNSNSTRPMAAPEEVIEQLPREVLEVGCASFSHDSSYPARAYLVSSGNSGKGLCCM